ncbi:hypothetical protein E1B28_004363 [Marasmius oreades]|uniref:Uncharacterized protein n=1 Tax=Marasmius oreades TaxID=181124 RepID=A0A9P7UYE2_9AGAR|nr:uncharacterized protein E1B28_004363 [Marasmius oreades]KAG7096966.1 hypothetical protein E1B28_004363 [Marasmius oreades]
MTVSSSLYILFLWFSLVRSVPLWESATGQVSINSLVPFATYVEAKGAGYVEAKTSHLALQTPGHFGNLTVSPNSYPPPMFYIRNNQLFLYANETSIFNVNVVNTTTMAPPTGEFPLQLVVDRKRKGVTNGAWRWMGTMLDYEFEGRNNGGVYYHCSSEGGGRNLVLFLKGVPTPDNCSLVTLHSFMPNT